MDRKLLINQWGEREAERRRIEKLIFFDAVVLENPDVLLEKSVVSRSLLLL